MLELVKYIVNRFAEDKENISYEVEETEEAVTITVLLSDSDMGKVIGKQGKIAKALRTLVRAASPKDSQKIQRRDQRAPGGVSRSSFRKRAGAVCRAPLFYTDDAGCGGGCSRCGLNGRGEPMCGASRLNLFYCRFFASKDGLLI